MISRTQQVVLELVHGAGVEELEGGDVGVRLHGGQQRRHGALLGQPAAQPPQLLHALGLHAGGCAAQHTAE